MKILKIYEFFSYIYIYMQPGLTCLHKIVYMYENLIFIKKNSYSNHQEYYKRGCKKNSNWMTIWKELLIFKILTKGGKVGNAPEKTRLCKKIKDDLLEFLVKTKGESFFFLFFLRFLWVSILFYMFVLY